jgi:aryl-alcohol dehydrogenase-like predicted oxidoreductase
MTTLPTRELGTTGMRLTTVGLGAWAMGGPGWLTSWGRVDDDTSVATILHAVEHGVNWVDTAPIYGHGHSEQVVGRALAALPAEDRPYVFTKCGLWWNPADRMRAPARDLTRIRRELEHSLRRLGVERVDLLQVHWPPFDQAVEDFWPTLVELRAEGKVRAIGVSNFDTAQLAAAEAGGHVDSLQPPLSLLRRAVTEAEIPWCHANRTGVIVYSPLESGLLGGGMTAERAAALPADDWRATGPEFTGERLRANLALVDALRPIAERHGVSVAAVAIGWTLSVPGVTGAIVGARNPDQIGGWLPAAGLDLTAADLAEIGDAVTARDSAVRDSAGQDAPGRDAAPAGGAS